MSTQHRDSDSPITLLDLSTGEWIVYDRRNEQAWIQTDTLEDIHE